MESIVQPAKKQKQEDQQPSNPDSESKRWYDLGCKVGEISKRLQHMGSVFQSNYGKSNAYFKLVSRCSIEFLCELQGELDEIVSAAFPRNVHFLPGYDKVGITDVFYNLNRYTCSEFNSTIQIVHPLPKKLSQEQKANCFCSVEFIIGSLNELDAEFFSSKNKNIAKTRTSLLKLNDFLML